LHGRLNSTLLNKNKPDYEKTPCDHRRSIFEHFDFRAGRSNPDEN
jgi:hypothetical protein